MRYAASIRLDTEAFAEDLKNETHLERVRDGRRFGVRSGVESTLNLFINGARYEGEMDVHALEEAVTQLTDVTIEGGGDREGAGSTTGNGTSTHPKARTTTVAEICEQRMGVDSEVLESVLTLAIEIAREGREGRKIGTLFTIGDAEAVMESSRALVMDPFKGHPDEEKHIDQSNLRETVKEFAQLDGGFVVTDEGIFLSAARYIDASSQGVDLPLGLGSRQMAGASISLHTGAVAIVVSESSMVRLFQSGDIASEIVPELWMLRRYGLNPTAPAGDTAGESGEVTVIDR